MCAPKSRQDAGRRMIGAFPLKVFLAGRVAVETNGVVSDEERFQGRQGRLLFAYLVAEQGRAVPRDELAEALWGRAPPASWDKSLTVIASTVSGRYRRAAIGSVVIGTRIASSGAIVRGW